VQSATECVPEVLRDGGPLVAERCPFDGVVAPSIEGNLEHMASCHGFFVPYIADLAKATELLEYLVRKVYLGYACIFCGGAFTSAASAQAHMEAKGHRKMASNHETFAEEYLRYYAFPPAEGGDAAGDDAGAGAKGQGDACDDGLQLESVCELLHDMTTGAMQNHSAVASGGIDTRGGVGGAGASGVKTQDEDVCLEESGAHMTGQDGQMGERVRAMLAARARRGLLSSEGGARGVRGYPPEQAAKGLWRDGPFALDTGEEELPDIKARRATLSVGSWAGPRTLARREKMLASSRGKAMRDKRKADAEQVQAVLVKYKQLGGALLAPLPSLSSCPSLPVPVCLCVNTCMHACMMYPCMNTHARMHTCGYKHSRHTALSSGTERVASALGGARRSHNALGRWTRAVARGRQWRVGGCER